MRVRDALLAAIAVATVPTAYPSGQTPSPDLLRRWTTSVLEHRPGTPDDAVRVTWTLSPEDLRYLQSRLPLLIAAVMGPTPPGEAVVIARLRAEIAAHVSVIDFLERAAVLHADAVMLDTRAPQSLPSEPAVLNGSPRARAAWQAGTIGTRPQSGFTTTRDGEITGVVASNPHWTFARFVLDRIPTGSANEFIGLWYHAVAAYFFSKGEFGELDWHLADENNVLPTDPRLFFDRGALAEVFSMNLMQEPAQEAARLGTPGVLTVSGKMIFSPAQGQDVAAAFYDRAVHADPKFAEAHVRLARLLGLKGRDGEGLDHIRLALDSAPEKSVLFYAHMFAARACATLGKVSDADAHARSALELFPEAQSALLAASQAALGHGDPDRAQLLLSHLSGQEGTLSTDRDPWIMYPYGPGRDAQTLLVHLRQATPTVH